MKFSTPYPSHPQAPYWGPPTAHINFCEEDYIFTTYIAELVNTITNITYIVYSINGLHHLRLAGRLTWSSALPLIGLIGVGVCSASFHATIREIPQLADDLSMIFPTLFITLRLLNFQVKDSSIATRNTGLVFAALLAVYAVHLNINSPILHSVTFGVMVHYIRQKTWKTINQLVPDQETRSALKRRAIWAGASFLLGFGLWLVDRLACSYVTHAKRTVGLPWGLFLELHGWWHILTAIGAYGFIVLVDHLTTVAVLAK